MITLLGKEPIYLCENCLKANDSTYSSTIENTNGFIENAAENSPIGYKNLQESFFKDNYSLKKAPPLLYFDVFYRFGPSPERIGFFLFFQDRASSGFFSSSIYVSPVLLGTTALPNICITPESALGRRFFTKRGITVMTLEIFS